MHYPLSRCLNKMAFELHPFNTGEMAMGGGLMGGLLGGGAGALSGLLGESDNPGERRRKVLRNGLIGLLAGGGLGAAGAGYAAGSARENIMRSKQDDIENQGVPSMRAISMLQLGQQVNNPKNRENFMRLLRNPTMLDAPLQVGAETLLENTVRKTPMGLGSSLRILMGDDPLRRNNGMYEEFDRGANNQMSPGQKERTLKNVVWNALKEKGLAP